MQNIDINTLFIQPLSKYLKDPEAIENSYKHLLSQVIELYNSERERLAKVYSVYPAKLNIIRFVSYYIRNEINPLPEGITPLDAPVTSSFQSINVNNQSTDLNYDYEIVIPYNLEDRDRNKLENFVKRYTVFNKKGKIIYRFQ